MKARESSNPKISSTAGSSQVPRQPHFDGRIQASHRDPSVGQRDRQRGYRLKGGKRVAQSAKEA